jgi:uridine monophosphate synthetase
LLLPTDTVQLQYTAGPLSIVKWAPIVNAHIFPGPAVITSLAEAAKKAINAYNTSVSTDISASPAPSALGSGNDEEEDTERDDNDDTNSTSSSSSSTDERNPDGSRRNSRQPRKHSVVSVSTTISTKTEAISPQPTLRPSMSRGSTHEDPSSDEMAPSADDESESAAADRKANLDHLGPPPYYRALLLLAQMSSKDNFFFPQYTDACAHHARLNRDFVMGFIAQKSMNSQQGDNFITMTPGVQKSAGGDGKGQQYNTPHKVVAELGTDVIIVGRGVYAAEDRKAEALEYRRQGWAAYEERLRAGRKSSSSGVPSRR